MHTCKVHTESVAEKIAPIAADNKFFQISKRKTTHYEIRHQIKFKKKSIDVEEVELQLEEQQLEELVMIKNQ